MGDTCSTKELPEKVALLRYVRHSMDAILAVNVLP